MEKGPLWRHLYGNIQPEMVSSRKIKLKVIQNIDVLIQNSGAIAELQKDKRGSVIWKVFHVSVKFFFRENETQWNMGVGRWLDKDATWSRETDQTDMMSLAASNVFL